MGTTEHSGKFVLRISPEIHGSLCAEAVRHKTSLNALCAELLVAGLANRKRSKPEIVPGKKTLIQKLQKKFGEHFVGLLVFGSQVTSETSPSSDIDLLVVVDEAVPIERALYRWWDDCVGSELPQNMNPQFALLPANPKTTGSLWYEVALAHEILWEKNHLVSRVLEALKESVASGMIRRYCTQGQPYWVWRTDAE